MGESSRLLHQKRRKCILDLVGQDAGVTTGDLAHRFGVSPSTIRRDLEYLETRGLLLKTHGGALPRSFSTSHEDPYRLKSQLQTAEKAVIGAAAACIVEGDTVVIDSGTTALEVARHARNTRFSAVALDLPVAMELAENPLVDLIVLGGNVRTGFFSIVGSLAAEMLGKLHVNKFFLGADAIHLEHGITNATVAEAPLKQLALRMARETILVSDSTKFGKISLMHVCDLREVHKIVTDTHLSPQTLSQLRELGVEVVLAS